jgi:sugar/nucleoside kinase (ribokinase family)
MYVAEVARPTLLTEWGVLGLNPILIAAVGKDWADYEAWLSRHGVDTSHALVSTNSSHRPLCCNDRSGSQSDRIIFFRVQCQKPAILN